jgi:phosphoribosyl 1,2-cyclic phosphodiesterase
MMRFALLGSGSRGNGTLVEIGDQRLLIDCGFTLRETVSRLARLGVAADDLTAILVTHEHGDHLRGVLPLARRYRLPIYLTAGTARHLDLRDYRVHLLQCQTPFLLHDIAITPLVVPHDAREPCQFLFDNGHHRLAVVTDLGHTTPYLHQELQRCSALVIESNHDEEMLRSGPYPAALKARVAGAWGHLSNAQTAHFVAEVAHSGLQHLVAAHLSEQNNHPDRVRSALATALGCEQKEIDLADQEIGLNWRQLI